MAEIGPGKTMFITNESGGIDMQMWNDPSWRTSFAHAHDLRRPESIASLLRSAYEAGWSDRGVAIRRAIGKPGQLG